MSAAEVLIDMGAIPALLDERDRWPVPCRSTIPQLRFPLSTSEAVLTETFHLKQSRTQMEAVWGLLGSGAIAMATIENIEQEMKLFLAADSIDCKNLLAHREQPADRFAFCKIDQRSVGEIHEPILNNAPSSP
jgi:hypothetical protein